MKSLLINKNKTGRVGKKVREIKTDCNITLGVLKTVQFTIWYLLFYFNYGQKIAGDKKSLQS